MTIYAVRVTSERHRQQRDPDRKRDRASKDGLVSRFTARQALWAVLVVLALWFVFSNGQSVEVKYIVGDTTAPLWLMIVLAIGVGMLLDRALVLRGRRKRRAD